jgi:hypothetical protein
MLPVLYQVAMFLRNKVKKEQGNSCPCIQDVCGADINKHWPGSDIILASNWTKALEVPLSVVHPMFLQYYSEAGY